MREYVGTTQFKMGMVVMLFASIVLTIIAPFDTAGMSLLGRSAYWLGMIYFGGIFIMPAQVYAIRTATLAGRPVVPLIALAAALAAIPATFGIAAVDYLLHPSPEPVPSLPMLWVQITAIGFVIGAVAHSYSVSPAHEPRPRETSALVERLDPVNGTDIISMSMQDHYVEVTTTRGTQLLLMRMTDAVREAAPIKGLRVHRSHWVAIQHVCKLCINGPKADLTLSDGRVLPVSATFRQALERELRQRTDWPAEQKSA